MTFKKEMEAKRKKYLQRISKKLKKTGIDKEIMKNIREFLGCLQDRNPREVAFSGFIHGYTFIRRRNAVKFIIVEDDYRHMQRDIIFFQVEDIGEEESEQVMYGTGMLIMRLLIKEGIECDYIHYKEIASGHNLGTKTECIWKWKINIES